MDVKLQRVDLSFDGDDLAHFITILRKIVKTDIPGDSKTRANSWLNKLELSGLAPNRTASLKKLGDLSYADIIEPDLDEPLTYNDIIIPGEPLPAIDQAEVAMMKNRGLTTQVVPLEKAERIWESANELKETRRSK